VKRTFEKWVAAAAGPKKKQKKKKKKPPQKTGARWGTAPPVKSSQFWSGGEKENKRKEYRCRRRDTLISRGPLKRGAMGYRGPRNPRKGRTDSKFHFQEERKGKGIYKAQGKVISPLARNETLSRNV